jgi:hypothetical protein
MGWKHTMVIKDCCHKYYFWNCMFLNFYQANMKRGFASGTWNKVVQNTKNKIVKNCNCYDILQSENILQKPWTNDYQTWWVFNRILHMNS